MKRKITTLFMLMALIVISTSAQYTTDGLYTLQAEAGYGDKYMSGGTPGSPMPMIESITDDAKFYIVENSANPGKYNIISLDEAYIASSTGAYGTLIENTEANRNSTTSGALVDLAEQAPWGVHFHDAGSS